MKHKKPPPQLEERIFKIEMSKWKQNALFDQTVVIEPTSVQGWNNVCYIILASIKRWNNTQHTWALDQRWLTVGPPSTTLDQQ